MREIDDSTHVGKAFGNWTVLEANIKKGRRKFFGCLCACGNERLVERENLLAGKSNGCRKCAGMSGPNNPRWTGHKDIPGQFYSIARKGAEIRGIDFKLSIGDLQELWERTDGRCSVSGIRIELGGKRKGLTASLDRIDSRKGYELGNIQFVHKDVNLMKNKFNQQYFIMVCSLIARHNDEAHLSEDVSKTACAECMQG
jgi:hypothetical protein